MKLVVDPLVRILLEERDPIEKILKAQMGRKVRVQNHLRALCTQKTQKVQVNLLRENQLVRKSRVHLNRETLTAHVLTKAHRDIQNLIALAVTRARQNHRNHDALIAIQVEHIRQTARIIQIVVKILKVRESRATCQRETA